MRTAWKRLLGAKDDIDQGVSEPPREVLERCQALLRKGKGVEAMKLARRGLVTYPYFRDLSDILRSTRKRFDQNRLKRLRQDLDQQPGPRTFRSLIQYFIEVGDTQSACDSADELLQISSDSAWSCHEHGLTYFDRFARERVAADGAVALRSLERAVDLDDSDPDYRFSLVRLVAEIGAVSKALYHLYLVRDLAPHHQGAEAMLDSLMLRKTESEGEGELLRRYEEADLSEDVEGFSSVASNEDIASDARTLSLIPGTARVAVRHPEVDLVALSGRVFSADGEEAAFHELAVGFDRAAALSSKRLGIGMFEEAELEWEGGHLLAMNAGRSVLTVELTTDSRREAVASEARLALASWTRVSGESSS